MASSLPSIKEILAHEVNALLVPPGDARALASAFRRLGAEPDLSARLATRAMEDVKAYSWDERGRKLAELLKNL